MKLIKLFSIAAAAMLAVVPAMAEGVSTPTDLAPAPSKAPVATEAPVPVFSGSIQIQLGNEGLLHLGDTVLLHAVVSGDDTPCAIVWEKLTVTDEGEKWVRTAEGEYFAYTLTADRTTDTYRAVAAGVVVSKSYKLPADRIAPDAPETPVQPEEAVLDLRVDISSNLGNGGVVTEGTQLVLTAQLSPDFAKLPAYTVQWQSSMDGAEWVDIPGATGESYSTTLVAGGSSYWRVAVTIPDSRN